MKALWIVAMTAGAVTVSSAWQDPVGVKSSDTRNASVETSPSELIGTDVVAELDKSVDAKKAKVGDLVKATITQDVLSHGKIVIRRGSKLVGHVTQTKIRSKEDRESRLGVVFDRAVLRHGGEIDLSAAVRALAPGVRMSSVDRPDPMGAPPGSAMGSGGAPMPISSGPASKSSGSGPPPSAMNQAARAAMQSGAATSGNAQEYGVMGGGSRGVFGLPGLRLSAESGAGRESIISSITHNVKLDSGTQMVIQVNHVAQ